MPEPEPAPSDEVLTFLDKVAGGARDFSDIGGALGRRATDAKDVQDGWLGVAFDYSLARRRRGEQPRPPFGPMLSNGISRYPMDLVDVPGGGAELWRNVLAASLAPAVRARLAHLLFERGGGDDGRYGREAASAYLVLGAGPWVPINRVNCLHWALELSRVVRDSELAEQAFKALEAMAAETLQAGAALPGVVFQALEAMVATDPGRPVVRDLLGRARTVYDGQPWHINSALELEASVLRGEQDRRALRRQQVEAWFAYAEVATGIGRLAALDKAAKLADRYHMPELVEQAVAQSATVPVSELGLVRFEVKVNLPADWVDGWVATFLGAPDLATALSMLVDGSPPTGAVGDNAKTAGQCQADAPLASLFPTMHVGEEGLPRYEAVDEEDREDELLARVELGALQLQAPLVQRVLTEVLDHFDATEAVLAKIFAAGPLVSAATASSLARAFCHFRSGEVEAAACVAAPRIETMARTGLSAGTTFRPQRQRARGQYAQLGALLGKLRGHLDESWWRFLHTFLVSPHGQNFRNDLLHGFVDQVNPAQAALVLVAALYLALRGEPVPPDEAKSHAEGPRS